MALSQVRTVFGVHSITPYDRTNGVPYGMARVLQGSTFTMEGDIIELKGGSNRFSWAAEDGDINAELAFSMSEYPNWLFTLFGGKAPTTGSAETSGNVTTITNKKGTSIVAATGILATATPTAANLKMGRYVLVATSSTVLDVYCLSDVDFARGTLGEFLDDSLKVGSLTISTGATDDVADHGLVFTGGASATAFVVGDTATFDVRPINSFNRVVSIGGISDVFPEFGCMVYGQRSGSGAIQEIEVYRMKNLGLSLGAERKAFGQSEYTAKAIYDSVKNGICRYREVE